jgi:conjugal transfer mating pair stabilization protein TraN
MKNSKRVLGLIFSVLTLLTIGLQGAEASPVLHQATTTHHYYCPRGTLVKTSCNYTITVSPKTSTIYTCPQGGTLSGFNCYSTKGSYPATAGQGGYICPNGGTVSSNNTCIVNIVIPATLTSVSGGTGTTTYTCPNGGVLSGTTCTTTTTYTAGVGNTVYTCPN